MLRLWGLGLLVSWRKAGVKFSCVAVTSFYDGELPIPVILSLFCPVFSRSFRGAVPQHSSSLTTGGSLLFYVGLHSRSFIKSQPQTIKSRIPEHYLE